MATKFYLRDTTSGVSGTLPSAEQSTLTSDKNATTQADNLLLSTTIGISTAAFYQWQTNSNTSLQDHYVARYVSVPIYHSVIDANTWTFAFAGLQGSTNANFPVSGADQPVYVNCYVWRPSTGTKVGTILDGDTASTVDEGATNATVYHIVNFTGAQVTGLQWEDVIVFEVWFRITPATASAHTLRFFLDGDTEYAENDTAASRAASNLSTPQDLVFVEPTIVTYQVTINEGSISLADTLKKKVNVKGMTVQTVVIGASTIVRKFKLNTLTVQTVIINASSIVRKAKPKVATQTVTIGASTLKIMLQGIISETGISLTDTLTKILSTLRTISDTTISFVDLLARMFRRDMDEPAVDI